MLHFYQVFFFSFMMVTAASFQCIHLISWKMPGRPEGTQFDCGAALAPVRTKLQSLCLLHDISCLHSSGWCETDNVSTFTNLSNASVRPPSLHTSQSGESLSSVNLGQYRTPFCCCWLKCIKFSFTSLFKLKHTVYGSQCLNDEIYDSLFAVRVNIERFLRFNLDVFFVFLFLHQSGQIYSKAMCARFS